MISSRRHQKGYTLIEIMVVIAVVAGQARLYLAVGGLEANDRAHAVLFPRPAHLAAFATPPPRSNSADRGF